MIVFPAMLWKSLDPVGAQPRRRWNSTRNVELRGNKRTATIKEGRGTWQGWPYGHFRGGCLKGEHPEAIFYHLGYPTLYGVRLCGRGSMIKTLKNRTAQQLN
jgi:hypothetical protein